MKEVDPPELAKLRLRTVTFVPNNPANLGTPLMVIVYPFPSNTTGVALVNGEMLLETIEFDVREYNALAFVMVRLGTAIDTVISSTKGVFGAVLAQSVPRPGYVLGSPVNAVLAEASLHVPALDAQFVMVFEPANVPLFV